MLQCLGILYCQLLKKNPTEKSPLTASSDCSLNNNQLHRHLIHTSLASQIISVHSAHTGSHQLRRKIYSLESAHLCPSLRVLNKTDSWFILSYLYLWQTPPLTSSSELHQANLSSQDYPTTTTTTCAQGIPSFYVSPSFLLAIPPDSPPCSFGSESSGG